LRILPWRCRQGRAADTAGMGETLSQIPHTAYDCHRVTDRYVVTQAAAGSCRHS
jgi:hypothetical protein